MKNIEWQVSSLESSKKLKELGVPQESLFYWVESESKKEKCPDCQKAGGIIPECFYCGGTGNGEPVTIFRLYTIDECIKNNRKFDYSAFTVAELELPTWLFTNGKNILCDMEKVPIIEGKKFDFLDATNGCKTEAEARAKILIYLLENKLIKVEDINLAN